MGASGSSAVAASGRPATSAADWAAVAASAGVSLGCVALFVPDSGTFHDTEKRRAEIEADLKRILVSRTVIVHRVAGPFEEEEADWQGQFDKGKSGMAAQKLVLETKKDGMTAIVALARQVGRFVPNLVIGEGQGAIIAAGSR